MTRRSAPQKGRDERRFPVRVRFRVEARQPGWPQRLDQMRHWLDIELGLDGYGWHADSVPGIHAFAVYFESVHMAPRFVDELGLAPLALTESDRASLK